MTTLTQSTARPETPPLSEFPDFSILEAIGRASHMSLAKAPAIGSLGWYMNMRDSGLSDEEIDELEKGTYTSPFSDSDSDPDSFALTIAPPPPPPLKRVTRHISHEEDEQEDNTDSAEIRNLITEFNAISWPSVYSQSPEVTFGSATTAEETLRHSLNNAIDEWNSKIDDYHPSRLYTNEYNEICKLRIERYRHLISAASSLLTDTFGCHVCRDRRSFRGACANCLDNVMTLPTIATEHVINLPLNKMKHQ